MITLEEAIYGLYHAKALDTNVEEVDCDRVRFLQQLEAGFKQNFLDLTNMQAGMNVMARIPKFFRLVPNLKHLHFYSNLFRDSGLQKIYGILHTNPQIVSVDVGCNDLTDSSMISLLDIVTNTDIKSLQLGRRDETFQMNRYTKNCLISVIDSIITRNSLQCFGISGIPLVKQKKTLLSRDFVPILSKAIAKCTNLKTLDISYCGLTDADQSIMQAGFDENQSLKILNISHNSFHKYTWVCQGICNIDSLIKLDISHCNLSEESCDIISNKFYEGWGLIDLNISGNPIGNNGISQLLSSLCDNITLVTLNISNTELGEDFVNELGEFLNSTHVLRDIDISNNIIGDSLAKAFAAVLPSQDSIEKINISTCRITDEGAFSLCKAIAKNSTIKEIVLKDNFLSQHIGFDLVEILRENESLQKIDLTSNQIDCFALEAIETLCQRNSLLSHDQVIHKLQKQCITLSIQSSKIPGVTDYLNRLTAVNRKINQDIDLLNEKIENYDLSTAGELEISEKGILGYLKIIDQEKKKIEEMKGKMRDVEKEKAIYIKGFQAKTQAEKAIFDELVKEADQIDAEIKKYKEEKEEYKLQIEKDIEIGEAMLKELTEIRRNPHELKKYIVPDYPFDDEYAPKKKHPKSVKSSRRNTNHDPNELFSDADPSAKKMSSKKKRGKSKLSITRPRSKKNVI